MYYLQIECCVGANTHWEKNEIDLTSGSAGGLLYEQAPPRAAILTDKAVAVASETEIEPLSEEKEIKMEVVWLRLTFATMSAGNRYWLSVCRFRTKSHTQTTSPWLVTLCCSVKRLKAVSLKHPSFLFKWTIPSAICMSKSAGPFDAFERCQ